MEPSFNSVGGIIGVQDHLVVRPSIEARSLQEFAKWRQFNKMRFDLVYWLEVVHSALVREIYSILFFNVANIIPSLKFRPTPTEFKENFYWFILCFRKFGAFSIFFYTHRTKKE